MALSETITRPHTEDEVGVTGDIPFSTYLEDMSFLLGDARDARGIGDRIALRLEQYDPDLGGTKDFVAGHYPPFPDSTTTDVGTIFRQRDETGRLARCALSFASTQPDLSGPALANALTIGKTVDAIEDKNYAQLLLKACQAVEPGSVSDAMVYELLCTAVSQYTLSQLHTVIGQNPSALRAVACTEEGERAANGYLNLFQRNTIGTNLYRSDNPLVSDMIPVQEILMGTHIQFLDRLTYHLYFQMYDFVDYSSSGLPSYAESVTGCMVQKLLAQWENTDPAVVNAFAQSTGRGMYINDLAYLSLTHSVPEVQENMKKLHSIVSQKLEVV